MGIETAVAPTVAHRAALSRSWSLWLCSSPFMRRRGAPRGHAAYLGRLSSASRMRFLTRQAEEQWPKDSGSGVPLGVHSRPHRAPLANARRYYSLAFGGEGLLAAVRLARPKSRKAQANFASIKRDRRLGRATAGATATRGERKSGPNAARGDDCGPVAGRAFRSTRGPSHPSRSRTDVRARNGRSRTSRHRARCALAFRRRQAAASPEPAMSRPSSSGAPSPRYCGLAATSASVRVGRRP